jgi:K(+)-stimulated pyrophosphate-energized sodium pump
LIFSIVGTWVIRIKNNDAKEKEVQGAFNLGNWGSLILTAIASFFHYKVDATSSNENGIFWRGN